MKSQTSVPFQKWSDLKFKSPQSQRQRRQLCLFRRQKLQ